MVPPVAALVALSMASVYNTPPTLITPLPAVVPKNNVFHRYEYANSPAASELGLLVLDERLIKIFVFAICFPYY